MSIEALPAAGPATHVVPPSDGGWDYASFGTLPEDGNRYEILGGVLYVAPPPSPQHQDRLFSLCAGLRADIRERKLGRLFVSPVALLMPGASPVQPDAFFLKEGNRAAIDWQRHVEGVPDLVIEVASPSTAGYDRREKQDTYARAGIHEYWIVDPWTLTIEVLVLDRHTGRYVSRGIFAGGSQLPTDALAGLSKTVSELLD